MADGTHSTPPPVNPDSELLKLLTDRAITERHEPISDALWAAVRALTPRPDDDYRIALRPDHNGNLDDVVVNDVSCFRMEDMGDTWWICCYLAGSTERICWSAESTTKRGAVRMITTERPMKDVGPYEAGSI